MTYWLGVLVQTCIYMIAIIGVSILSGFCGLFTLGHAGFMAIGAYAAAMGGVDVIVFTAGVGENDKNFRLEMTEGLEFMGITCDEEKNNTRGEERIISKDGAPVTVMVIPTTEELMIAQDTLSIVEENKNK